VWALVAQQLTLSAVSLAAVWMAVSWRPGFRNILPAMRDLRRFSTHSVAEFLAFAVASRADALLLGSLVGPVALGLYRFSNRLVEMVMELGAGGLNQVTLPHLSRFGTDRAEFTARLGTIMHLGMAIALPTLGTLAGTGTQLLAVLGPEWTDAAPGLRVLCLAGAFMVVGTILAPAIQALGRPGTGALLGWAEAVCMVGAMLVVGRAVSSAPAGRQVTAMATTLLAVQVVFVATTALVAFRMILRQPIGPALRRMTPAATAGLCAAATGWGVSALLPPLAPVLALLAVGASAGAMAATVLLALDRTAVRSVLTRRAGRAVRSAEPPVDSIS
jgi:O-antigen/teichoic acid export membrane protein